MQYQNCVKGVFLNRPNRFIAQVEIGGVPHTVHVKNTGRCKELLVPRCIVYLEASDNPTRKTKYDLIAVEKKTEKGVLLINMDSQAPNDAAAEWLPKSGLFSPAALFRREFTYGDSRFDFQIQDGEKTAFMEVKGVTLEQDGVALFPDAPTLRGVKHLNELIRCVKGGYDAYILFVIQMQGARLFSPNDSTHKAFGDALREAQRAGVKILAMDCTVTKNSMKIRNPVPIEL